MARVVLFGELSKPKIAQAVADTRAWLQESIEVVSCDTSGDDGQAPEGCDWAVVFGGDGTMLAAARAMGANQIPVVGVNMGRFGFLAEILPEGIRPSLERVLAGSYAIVTRMMLDVQVMREGEQTAAGTALNDAVVSRSHLSRVVSIDLRVDNVWATTYNADGLIVSSPVGSTAHSLSAGGPIVDAAVDAFVVTPICPHTLANRSLIESPDCCLEMVVRSNSECVGLTLDGQVFLDLRCGDHIRVTRSNQRLHLITFGVRRFYEALRDKLHWGGHPRYRESQDT